MTKVVPTRELRRNLSELLDDVASHRDHVIVTRNGRPTAALVPVDEYEALEQSAEILSDPDALAPLDAGLAETAGGERQLRALRRGRRSLPDTRRPPQPARDDFFPLSDKKSSRAVPAAEIRS